MVRSSPLETTRSGVGQPVLDKVGLRQLPGSVFPLVCRPPVAVVGRLDSAAD